MEADSRGASLECESIRFHTWPDSVSNLSLYLDSEYLARAGLFPSPPRTEESVRSRASTEPPRV